MTMLEEAIKLFEKLDQEEKLTYLSRLSVLVNMQKEGVAENEQNI